jgi:hypothetical protein
MRRTMAATGTGFSLLSTAMRRIVKFSDRHINLEPLARKYKK